jgi:hypothetical protein
MVRHQVSLGNLALLLPGQNVENRSQMMACLPEDGFAPPLRYEHNVVLAVPFRMGWALVKFRQFSFVLLSLVLIKPPEEDSMLERSNLFESHWSNQWLT